MQWLRKSLALLLLLVFLPAWRMLDWLAISWPQPLLFSLLLAFLSLLFFCYPLKLWRPSLNNGRIFFSLCLIAGTAYLFTPLSSHSTQDPDLRHCGGLTYTGAFHHLKWALSYAFQDDLSLRNQLCWVRKLNQEVPVRLSSDEELYQYFTKVEDKLLLPLDKFRVTLPLIAILHAQILSHADSAPHALAKISRGKKLVDLLHLWTEHYNTEIGVRRYSSWDWPLSAWIQFEYGLIERHWQSLVDAVIPER